MKPTDWRDEPPDHDAALSWFDRMQRLYSEPMPSDPDEREAWITRGLAWAREVDPRGSEAAMEALIIASGVAEPIGVTEDGQVQFRSLVYKPPEGADE